MSPHPEPSSHLTPTPSLWVVLEHQLLSALLHASNLHWSSILHMVVYMFQCYSLKSSTLAFAHIFQKSILYTCVSFSALHIGSSLLSKFHMYALRYCIGGSLIYFTVSSTSLELTQMCSFLQLSNIPLCVYTTTSLSIHLLMNI